MKKKIANCKSNKFAGLGSSQVLRCLLVFMVEVICVLNLVILLFFLSKHLGQSLWQKSHGLNIKQN